MATPTLISKLPDVGETIFSIMSSLAQKHQAINLGQGFPDYSMDERLIELLKKAMMNGHNQYTHTNGSIELRMALAEKIHFLYKKTIDPYAEICITPGATYAIYSALTTVLRPGNEVLLFEPAYDSYLPNIELNGAIPIRIELKYPDYKIDWQEVRDRITPATRMILLNSPHNPTGTVLDEQDIKNLSEIVEDFNLLILGDEVYEHIIFNRKKHESILKYPNLFKRSFITFSLGKVFNCTGWKIGFCVAPKELMQEFLKVHQFNAFSCFSPAQFAMAEFLKEKENYLHLGEQLENKKNYFQKLMAESSFKPLPTYGSYFQLYNYESLSQENELDFAKKLTTQAGVTAIPVSAFYKEPVNNFVLRFCFAKKEATLKTSAERLIQFEKKISSGNNFPV
jgi:methionine aminotransferase